MTTASDRAVVLTTNERDALAIYEATDGALAFALPNGERIDSNVRLLFIRSEGVNMAG